MFIVIVSLFITSCSNDTKPDRCVNPSIYQFLEFLQTQYSFKIGENMIFQKL